MSSRVKSAPFLAVAVLGLALGLGGCTKLTGGDRSSLVGLGSRCDADAGHCDPNPAWALMPPLGSFRGLATGRDGAVYLTGTLRAPGQSFEGTSITYGGGLDVVVARVEASSGKVTWVRRIGEAGVQEPMALAVLSDQTVVVVGRFEGTLRADAVNVTSPRSTGADFLLALRGSDGHVQWAQVFDDGAEGAFRAVATAQGRIAVCGQTSEAPAALVPGASFQGGRRDAVVAMFDASGKRLWARDLGGKGDDTCEAVVIEPGGDVYALGRYSRSFTMASPLPDTGADHVSWIWLARLDGRSGEVTSQGSLGGYAAPQYPTTLAVAPGGQLVVGGLLNGAMSFGGDAGTLVSAGYGDAFVARLDPSSTPPFAGRWAVRLGGPSVDGTRSVAVDPYGDVGVAGYFTFRTQGAAELTSELPGTEAFLLMLDGATGSTRSARSYGDPDTQTAERIAFGRDAEGKPYLVVGGDLTGTIQFGALPPLDGGSAGATFLMLAR